MIKGSKLETDKMNTDSVGAIAVIWNDIYSSHAFILEQILTKLEKAGYASREEIIENWKIMLNEE